jgi:hypothetical protein
MRRKTEEQEERTNSRKKILFSAATLIVSWWIANNIYTAYDWEISSFFEGLIDKVCNFFEVIFTGKSNAVRDVEFSWWALLLCVPSYRALYSGIKILILWEYAFPPRVPSKAELEDQNDVGAKILAKYSTYNEFVERFEGFDQLSCKAKKEVRRLYEWW